MSAAFDNATVVARPWSNHGPSSICTEVAGVVVQLAECSGFGRDSADNEAVARRMAACWNSCNRVSTEMLEQIDGLVAATVPYRVLLAALNEIVANDPFNQSSAGVVARRALKAQS